MDAAHELSRLLGPLRRLVLRRTREAAGLPDIPDAQIELLRTLDLVPGLGVRDAAHRMRVAPATVSNLVRVMVAQDLVARRRSPSDLRVVGLVATPEAKVLLRRYDTASAELVDAALGRLSRADRGAVTQALPALNRLLGALDDADA